MKRIQIISLLLSLLINAGSGQIPGGTGDTAASRRAKPTFRIPVGRSAGGTTADVAPGTTTLAEALKTLPAGDTGSVSFTPRFSTGASPASVKEYQPSGTRCRLFFDRHERLVVLQDSAPPVPAGKKREVNLPLLWLFPGLRETARTGESFDMEAPLSIDSCIGLRLSFNSAEDTLIAQTYFFICGSDK